MAYWTTFRRRADEPDAPGDWDVVDEDERAQVLEQLGPLLAHAFAPAEDTRVLRTGLRFYPGTFLYEFVELDREPRQPAYVVAGPEGAWPLDGSNVPVYRLNGHGMLHLDDDCAPDYLRFFLAHVAGRHGRFVLHETSAATLTGDATDEQLDALRTHARPLQAARGDDGGYVFEPVIRFQSSLMSARVAVGADGRVEIDSEAIVASDLPLAHDRPADAHLSDARRFDLVDGWVRLADLDEDLVAALDGLAAVGGSDEFDEATLRFMPLSFFDDVVLTRIAPPGPDTGFGLYGLWSGGGLHLLRGRSKDIYEAIEREVLHLDDDNAADYLAFFCFFTHGDDGPFRVVRRVAELNCAEPPTQPGEPPRHALPVDYSHLPSGALDLVLRETTLARRADSMASFDARVCVQYGGHLFLSSFEIGLPGEVRMLDDRTLVTGIPFDQRLDKVLLPGALATHIAGPDALAELVEQAERRSTWPAYLNERELEASVLAECVRLQLVRALRAGGAAPLFVAPDDADDESLLVAFATFVFEVHPVVVIESRTTYIERIVSALLIERVEHSPKVKTVDASPYNHGEGMVDNLRDGDFWQISMHEWYTLRRPEAIAYQLGVTNSITVIGCDAQSAIPEALRRVTDVVVVLDNVDETLFRTTFCRLFDCDWPGSEGDTLWQRYVGPGDFYQPLRNMLQTRRRRDTGQGWQPESAMRAIRERVLRRLSPIHASGGPALADIHGLGEARQILLDVITDVRAAVAGDIEWREMDRGLLLAGEPGTGKTMLARAMAKDCGVRFIQASEARWAAGSEHLGQHIREIRATFAEARRYAPSILFIDELDSIGNRELFQGRNRQYCVEIVNALLQELEGIEGRDGVFVIGATNYLERVDAALLRAGRLDQVVRVRRPNRKALEQIIAFHLREYRDAGRVADDLDVNALAALANGATGADIELFVRDASRRARKDGGGPISQRHLAAAITRAPRDHRTARPVGEVERERTAVHEAGHALAMLLCENYPASVNMVSIIPRSDGSLGFTGFKHDERSVFTRRDYEEYLRVLLAGRAAEELIYGRDGISSGAGGATRDSDLALASHLASRLVCQLGMGPGATLRWRESAEDGGEVAAMRGLLGDAYDRVLAALTARRPLLEALRDRLLERHEIFAADVTELAARHGLDPEERADA